MMAEGSAKLSFDRVAREAGVSRTTLHKWWPSRGALAVDSYLHFVADALAFPDTGDVRSDLLQGQLLAFAQIMTSTAAGRVLLELIGAAQADPDMAIALRRLYSTERRRLASDRLRRAQERGEIRPDVDVQVLVDQLWGAVYNRLLVPDEVIDGRFIEALVVNLLEGVGPPHPATSTT